MRPKLRTHLLLQFDLQWFVKVWVRPLKFEAMSRGSMARGGALAHLSERASAPQFSQGSPKPEGETQRSQCVSSQLVSERGSLVWVCMVSCQPHSAKPRSPSPLIRSWILFCFEPPLAPRSGSPSPGPLQAHNPWSPPLDPTLGSHTPGAPHHGPPSLDPRSEQQLSGFINFATSLRNVKRPISPPPLPTCLSLRIFTQDASHPALPPPPSRVESDVGA